MNLIEAVRVVGEEAGITQREAKIAVKTFLDMIVEEIASEGKSQLYGLGTFSLFNTAPKLVPESFNGPRTKLVPSKRVVKFSASPELNRQVAI
jgi:nucleoid DNA-binding protein